MPRSRRLSNAYDDRRRSCIQRTRSIKQTAFEIIAEVVEQVTPRGVCYVPVARHSNGDCLRGCYRESRSDSERIARALADRLKERTSHRFSAYRPATPADDADV